MRFTNLPNTMKIKVRLAESLERLAEGASSVDAEYDLLARADALHADVEAYVREVTR